MYSDFYKDAMGFRPRFDTDDWTLESWESEFDYLRRVCEENEGQERTLQAAAIETIEARIANLISIGADDRATAIKWLMDGDNVAGDEGFFEYLNDLPYGYITGTKPGMKEAV
jgi:hypothetical protein